MDSMSSFQWELLRFASGGLSSNWVRSLIPTALQGSGDCPLCVWEKAENETYTISDSVSYILQGIYIHVCWVHVYSILCVYLWLLLQCQMCIYSQWKLQSQWVWWMMECVLWYFLTGTTITKCAVTSSETFLITLTSSVCAYFRVHVYSIMIYNHHYEYILYDFFLLHVHAYMHISTASACTACYYTSVWWW